MKPKIAGIIHEDKYLNITFLKKQSLLKVLAKILSHLKAREELISVMVTGKCICDENYTEKEQKITQLKDRTIHFQGKNFIVDIVFGNKKVFFLANLKLKQKKEVMKILTKECDWVKEKKIKKK
jgi:hypothetical protein